MITKIQQFFLYHPSSHQRLFWSLQILGWLALSTLTYVALTLWYTTDNFVLNNLHTLAQSAVGLILSLILRRIFIALWDRPVVGRMLMSFVSVTLVALLWNIIRLQLFLWIVFGASSASLGHPDWVFNKASIFFNFGVDGASVGQKVYYWDDVSFGDSKERVAPSAEVSGSYVGLPITFDNTSVDYSLSDFGGNYTSIGPGPFGSVGNVAITVKGTNSKLWAGTTMSSNEGFASAIPLTKNNSMISVWVYSPDVGMSVRMKLEDSNNTEHSVETEVLTTLVNTWEPLVFDFNVVAPGFVESSALAMWGDFGGWYFTALLVFLCWSSLYYGIKYALMFQAQRDDATVEAREAKVVSLKASSSAKEAQLQMLRYQLNPHFLFNTLNAIYALIKIGDQDPARGMVMKLSKFLRYSLDSDPNQLVTLSQELDALNLYLEIEKIRFGSRLKFVSNITPEANNFLVPELILQPLVENSIKYAVADQENGGTITIDAEVKKSMLVLTVSDDGPGVELIDGNLPCPGGIGLSNTQSRLENLYGDKQSFRLEKVDPHGFRIVMCLPFEE